MAAIVHAVHLADTQIDNANTAVELFPDSEALADGHPPDVLANAGRIVIGIGIVIERLYEIRCIRSEFQIQPIGSGIVRTRQAKLLERFAADPLPMRLHPSVRSPCRTGNFRGSRNHCGRVRFIRFDHDRVNYGINRPG